MQLDIHEAANEFPLFDKERLQQLADDIKAVGQGRHLFLEWKKSTAPSPSGKQLEALKSLSNCGLVLVGFGDAMTMKPDTLHIWDRCKRFIVTERNNADSVFEQTIRDWHKKII